MANSEDPLGHKWKFWGGILGGLVVLAVVGWILIPFATRGDKADDNASPSLPSVSATADTPGEVVPSSGAATSPTGKPSPTKKAGDCPTLSTNNALPVEAPKTEWDTHPSGMYLPLSEEYGPAKIDSSFWRCYSHTSTGALFAGVTLMMDFENSGHKDAAYPSENRDAVFAEMESATLDPGGLPRISGYKIVGSSDSSATIQYLAESEDGPAALTVNLKWDESVGDWRLDVSNGAPEVAINADPNSFTDWGGEDG